ncbi:hypothetical protein NLU13_4224 [Sarocladium strictum]|uniref:Uncharacterized protein n=1 Tax=Sarocladium strictum TaxID=5046 RepID=A0AA39L8M0_SARSR|nr:hypothetical protein NLU13_4224 [Sarocladium strictum]
MLSRIRQPGPQSRSRFQEGSMNDRASAAPPVQFLEKEENVPPSSYYDDVEYQQQRYHIPRKPVRAQPHTATIRAVGDDEACDYISKPQAKEKTASKKSSRIFGQVWDGVFGMLSGKSGSSNGSSNGNSGRKKTPSMMSTASTATSTSARGRNSKEFKVDELRARLQQNDPANRPSKEDVLQSYQELVASGFFSSHAIQSTRHSRPGTAKSNTPAPTGDQRPASPPQWPLSTPSKQRPSNHQLLQQHQPHTLSPIPMTPGSAGSRGTKRAAATEEDDDDQDPAPRSGSKKLRKSASRDVSGAGPRLRSVGSRRILSRRSFSGAPSKGQASHSPPQALVTVAGPLQPTASPGKLTKRCPPPATTGRPSIRAPLPVPGRSSSSCHQASRGRNVSENVAAYVASDLDTRVLRPRRSALTGAEIRSVVPDVHRGIPGVPAIPPEFTYGEDREVGGPWRGLRR